MSIEISLKFINNKSPSIFILYISYSLPSVYSFNHSGTLSFFKLLLLIIKLDNKEIIPGVKHDFDNKFIFNSSITKIWSLNIFFL